MDTPFRVLSNSADIEFKGTLPDPRMHSALGVTQGQLYVFSGQSVPDEESEAVLFEDLIMLEIECDDMYCVEVIEKKTPWPAPRLGQDSVSLVEIECLPS